MNSKEVAAPGEGVVIEVRGVTRVDPQRRTALLHATDFCVRGGDRVVLTGASGSGKSVLLRTLALLDAPDAGQLLWRGERVANAQVPRYRRHVGYLSQRPAMIEGTVEDNLRLPYSLKAFADQTFNPDSVTELLTAAGKTPAFLQQAATELSGGEAQVVALIRVLQTDPEVLLLDEPTAALDPLSARTVEQLVRVWFDGRPSSSRAYVWVSHNHVQAERVSNRRLTMDAGRLRDAPTP
jgi:putative ABC transport system ATP-binding protein